MTSMRVKQVKLNGKCPIFKINGIVHHQARAFTPDENTKHAFSQIYILDLTEQIDLRVTLNGLADKKKMVII